MDSDGNVEEEIRKARRDELALQYSFVLLVEQMRKGGQLTAAWLARASYGIADEMLKYSSMHQQPECNERQSSWGS